MTSVNFGISCRFVGRAEVMATAAVVARLYMAVTRNACESAVRSSDFESPCSLFTIHLSVTAAYWEQLS